MKTTIVKTFSAAIVGLIASTLFTACSEIEYEGVAGNSNEKVNSLSYTVTPGSRSVTLNWGNPSQAGQSGIRIIQDDKDITDFDEVMNSYFIKRAPINVETSYTVKARYQDGRMSEGQTVRFNLAYTIDPTKATKFAMLVPEDYEESADETSAVEWFQKTYVDTGKGDLLTPSMIDDLDCEEHAVCWVMCDRIGISSGWKNLPGDLATNAVVNALRTFTADGGRLFLTNHATQMAVAIGRLNDSMTPTIFGSGEGGPNNDIWGVHPVIGNVEGQIYDHINHDIYKGMTYRSDLFAGIYCFEGPGIKGDHNCMWDMNAMSSIVENPNKIKDFEDKTNSTVLGTWNHVVDYCCAGIVDFEPTTSIKGRILAVGLAAYEWNIGQENEFQDQLEMFTSNCLDYLK